MQTTLGDNFDGSDDLEKLPHVKEKAAEKLRDHGFSVEDVKSAPSWEMSEEVGEMRAVQIAVTFRSPTP